MDLFDKFTGLAPAISETEYAVILIGDKRQDYLAKTINGAPVFLLHDSSDLRFTPGVTLKNLNVQFHVACRVRTPSGLYDGSFALIACDSAVPELYELFVRCVGIAIEQLPNDASTRDIDKCIRSLLNLFRMKNGPEGREVVGLWAELFVISRAIDIRKAVAVWHADMYERYDFSWIGGLLEVKATRGEFHIHEFGLDQLEVPSSGNGFVASLLMKSLTNGIGVMDLAAEIEPHLSGDLELRERLWSNIVAALGRDFSEKLDQRFDVGYTERTLMLFHMGDIPAPEPSSDPRISNIRFRVNLSDVSSTLPGPAIKMLKRILESKDSAK